jgi:hypothetical protein
MLNPSLHGDIARLFSLTQNTLVWLIFDNIMHNSTVCFAKHANDKAAKWAASKRPKKSNLSDRNHRPTEYALHSMVKPPEYAISEEPAEPVTKKET